MDILGHLNDLNLQLQGKGQFLVDLWQKLKWFSLTASRFIKGIVPEYEHFPTLTNFVNEWEIEDINFAPYVPFFRELKENIDSWFGNFRSVETVLEITANPNLAITNNEWKRALTKFLPQVADSRAIELELCDLNAHCRHKNACNEFYVRFCTGPDADIYPKTKKLAITVLTVFGSTYVYELGFS